MVFKKSFHFIDFSNYLILILMPFFLFIDSLNLWLWIPLVVLFIYLASTISIIIYSIYDDHIEIMYPTRIYNRVKFINYINVEKVVYVHLPRSRPSIAFLKANKRLISPSNSVSYRTFKKRQEVLRFLQSKGLTIENRCSWKKDMEILD